MTKVAILPVPTKRGEISYCAVAGNKQTQGKTAGEALDALTAQLSEDEAGTLIIIQNLHSDRFFDTEHQQRLSKLMESWRTARDNGKSLPEDEQVELEAVVKAELRASAERSAVLIEELKK